MQLLVSASRSRNVLLSKRGSRSGSPLSLHRHTISLTLQLATTNGLFVANLHRRVESFRGTIALWKSPEAAGDTNKVETY